MPSENNFPKSLFFLFLYLESYVAKKKLLIVELEQDNAHPHNLRKEPTMTQKGITVLYIMTRIVERLGTYLL